MTWRCRFGWHSWGKWALLPAEDNPWRLWQWRHCEGCGLVQQRSVF